MTDEIDLSNLATFEIETREWQKAVARIEKVRALLLDLQGKITELGKENERAADTHKKYAMRLATGNMKSFLSFPSVNGYEGTSLSVEPELVDELVRDFIDKQAVAVGRRIDAMRIIREKTEHLESVLNEVIYNAFEVWFPRPDDKDA